MENDEKYSMLFQRALCEIQALKSKIKELEEDNFNQPIAVVGMACKLPLHACVYNNSFWDLLEKGINTVTEIPKSRWDFNKYYNDDPSSLGCSYTRYGSFLENISDFDPQFFGISPREAICIDPQHRLILEVAWEALEDSGITLAKLRGTKTGIFLGQCAEDFSALINNLSRREFVDSYSGIGASRSMLAGRLAYILGTHGPAIQLDTSCSSSLVAVHLACQSLRLKESDTAFVGGVHLNLSPMSSILRSKTKALSPDGQCKAFSSNANGFGQGEGAGILVLRLLEDAKKSGDRILAIIKGSAINHDGASAGLTAPNESAQVAVIEQALLNSKIDPNDVTYIEAHGTGTPLGDPIEINALNSVYNSKQRSQPIWIGSVKSNLGHLEAAAGVIGIIKTILAMRHQKIPMHLHADQLNPLIDWKNLPFKVPTTSLDWITKDDKRIAGVSAFGMSGTNAHVILQEYQIIEKNLKSSRKVDNAEYLFLLSAKTPLALSELADRYARYLETSEEHLFNICFTAATARNHFKYRAAIICQSNEELKNRLEAFVKDGEVKFKGEVNQSKLYNILFALDGNHRLSYNGVFSFLQECFIELDNTVNESQTNLSLISNETIRNYIIANSCLINFFKKLGLNPTSIWAQGVGELIAGCALNTLNIKNLRYFSDSENFQTAKSLILNYSQIPIFFDNLKNKVNDQICEAPYWEDWSKWESKDSFTDENIVDFDLTCWLSDLIKHPEKILEIIAKVYCMGAKINWEFFYAEQKCRRIQLPPYPFQRKNYGPDTLKLSSS